jgi:hypothetical protein
MTGSMISEISRQLFADTPSGILYHYTSFGGMVGIVGSGELRASDIRYMNDSAELRHTLELLKTQVTQRIIDGTDFPTLHNQLLEWLSHRVVSGPMLFGASFRANGNLLSQWRGYSVHGKGVSLGFDPGYIQACAGRQRFEVAKCLYAPDQQSRLIGQVVDAIEATADEIGEVEDPARRHPKHSFYDVFEHIEGDLLRIAAILKHPSFEEEQEWRLVSPVIDDCHHPCVHFREGWAMMIPYYAFPLVENSGDPLTLEHVFLGPTNNVDLSMNSLELYLEKMNSRPVRGVGYCQIPFRQRPG